MQLAKSLLRSTLHNLILAVGDGISSASTQIASVKQDSGRRKVFIKKLRLYNGLQSDVQELSAIGVSRGAANDKWLHWGKFMQVVCFIKPTPIHLFINSLCLKSRFVTGFETRSPVLILRNESANMVEPMGFSPS